MIHHCPCGFATDDQLWFESHQAQHILKRDHDVTGGEVRGLADAELERARRDLAAAMALATPGSSVRAMATARISAIDAELASRGGDW
jgi:hypothetical protein